MDYNIHKIISYLNFNEKNYIFIEEEVLKTVVAHDTYAEVHFYGNEVSNVDGEFDWFEKRICIINDKQVPIYREYILPEDLQYLMSFCQMSLEERIRLCDSLQNKFVPDINDRYVQVYRKFLHSKAILSHTQEIIVAQTGERNNYINDQKLLNGINKLIFNGKKLDDGKGNLNLPNYCGK